MTIGVNTFRVNSITLNDVTLFIGVENFGVVVYDMASMNIKNLLSV